MIDPLKPDYTNLPGDERRARTWHRPAAPVTNPGVSIVTPFFNDGRYLAQTARCILDQTYQNFEWIIVDDASTDEKAVETARAIASADPRIRLERAPQNGGPSAARNLGFRLARAPLVYQLDADDLIEPTTIEKCAWFMATRPECAFCNGFEAGFGAQEYLWANGFHTPDLFLRECPVGAHAVMVRHSAHDAAGGYDESIRGGMEDWEFWLRCADRNIWGDTIPEYLSWYRRRENHNTRWADWDGGERQRRFHESLKTRFPRLFQDGPRGLPRRPSLPFDTFAQDPPLSNSLCPASDRKRLLCIVPWFTMGGADKFNLRVVEQLVAKGWQVTLAGTLQGTQNWLHLFAALAPDVFVLPHFVQPHEQPLFLRYLIESRKPDVVLISNSEMGYQLLPYLRAHCPRPAYADYNHMEEAYWKNGGYPRYAAASADQLDLSIVSSAHLRNWIVSRGGVASRIEVCTTNEDTQQWKPDPDLRHSERERLGISKLLPVLLYAGRICQQKQPRVFGGTILELHRRGLAFAALVAGDGPDRAELEEFASRHGLTRHIRFLGAVPNDAMRGLMAASDIFFLPSLWEGISLAVYEAMAAGLAVVGADVGGQKELVTPDCGVLIARASPEDEIQAYAHALSPLIADPSLAHRIGDAARRRLVEQFQLSHMGDRMQALLQQAMALRDADPRPVIPAGLAHELAVRAVEYVRVHNLADYLWEEREKLRQMVGAPAGHAPAPPPSVGAGADPAAELELSMIEHSRFYGMVKAAKNNPVYRALARMRWGPHWDLIDPNEPASQRLRRIKTSRSYKLIQAIKSTGVYRVYSFRKHGGLTPTQDAATHLNGVSSDPSRAKK